MITPPTVFLGPGAIQPTPAPPPTPAPGPASVPGFDLIEEIGRGGMGVVYKARQHGLNRVVALKMILSGHFDERQRFLAEAEAAAAIRHRNVVQVHEFGEANGQPYLAMEFVDGGSLSRLLSTREQLDPREAANLVEQIARGVQVAHEQGIIHRDLKPANILLGRDKGETTDRGRTKVKTTTGSHAPAPSPLVPKVSDFGIAKRGTGQDLTMTGAMLGTPAYMSPEQARGQTKFVGPGADVYALGVILYECLTGQTPFKGETAESLIFQVVRSEPPPVRERNPDVPRDLELICLKCLQKWPHERYPSAAALADDLARFLADEPVSVRPPGMLEKAAKWARRHPARATVYALALITAGLSAITSGAIVLGLRADEARHAAEDALTASRAAELQAADERDKAEIARREADEHRGKAVEAKGALDYVSAVHGVDLAFREYQFDNPARARQLLDECPEQFRAWEWRVVDRLVSRQLRVLTAPNQRIRSFAFGPNDEWLATAGQALTIWDLKTGRVKRTVPLQAQWVAASKDGKLVAVTVRYVTAPPNAPTGDLWIIDPNTGVFQPGIPVRGTDPDFHPDGKRVLLSGAGGAVIWDLATSTATKTFFWPSGQVRTARFSPTGDRVVVSGLHEHRVIAQGADVKDVVFKGAIRIYDTDTGMQLAANLEASAGDMPGIAWSADGTKLVTAPVAGSVSVWNAQDLKLIRSFSGYYQTLWSVAFSADGNRVASCGIDRTTYVWDTNTGQLLDSLRGHTLPVLAVRFTPDGNLVTGSEDSSIRFWKPFSTPSEVTLQKAAGLSSRVTISNDGRYVVTAAMHQKEWLRVWDTRSGLEVAATEHPVDVRHLAFSGDGSKITTVGRDGSAHEWDWKAKGLHVLPNRKPLANVAAIAPNCDRVVLRQPGQAAVIVDARTGTQLATLASPHFGDQKVTAINADGTRVVTGGEDGRLRIWDATTGAELLQRAGHPTPVKAVAFSPDGSRFATAGGEGWVKVWDTRTGLEVLTQRTQLYDLQALGWSPDGSKLVAVGLNTLRVLDAGP